MARTDTVYLIHLEEPLGNPENPRGQAQHYIGSTTDLPGRMLDHGTGRGARMLQAANEQGISWTCVRTWRGGRRLERRLKARKKARCLCPICNPDLAGVEPPQDSQGVLL